MQFTFLTAAGVVLFVRDDMEQGNWTQEEYTVNATFPYDAGKVIQRGQRITFRDPATNALEIFEVRNVTNIEPDAYQQIIAEHIVVSELSDDHIDQMEITNKTPKQALTSVLTGTLWSAGNTSVSAQSSVDISRGNVWQAVGAIMNNWNCYITPRVTFNSAGAITGRYLDITPAQGIWRGVRLSISKNISDSSVVYDDSELYTALYGYGGSVEVAQTGQDDRTEELTFKDVSWSKTSSHPAKPKGQTYLEDPAKTALYGRNGRARFGYYQNSDITDANTLLEKTWETLKQVSNPTISITGTVTDLYRLGYADQPLRLHDTAIVEIAETGEKFEKEIIKLDVDLLDPTATRVDIGDYIPNIIYINRSTNTIANGGRGGGGRAGNVDKGEQYDTYSALEKRTDEYGSMIAMVVGRRNGDNYIKAGEIGLSINQSGETGQYESTAYINADHVNISATTTAYALAGDLEHDADGKLIIKSAGGMYVKRNEGGIEASFGVWDRGNLTGGIMVQQINEQEGSQTKLTIKADVIDIQGVVEALKACDIECGKLACDEFTVDQNIDAGGTVFANEGSFGTGGVTIAEGGLLDCYNIDCADISADDIECATLKVGSPTAEAATWQTKTIRHCALTNKHYYLYAADSTSKTPSGSIYAYAVYSYTDSTIHYLGKADT